MKCPKCQYLGFDTGTRCRNCGYDFSLLALADETGVGDVMLRTPDPPAGHPVDPMALAAEVSSLDDLPLSFELAGAPAPAAARPLSLKPVPPRVRRQGGSSAADAGDDVAHEGQGAPGVEELPLFSPAGDDHAPLVRVPAAPRPPLAVRRTPDVPRVSRPPAPVRRDVRPPMKVQTLERSSDTQPPMPATGQSSARAAAGDACAASRRAVAAAIDTVILGGLHLIVLYFTIRVAGLTVAEWRQLPPVPLVGFLMGLTVAYQTVLTAVGGQTIGKMAADIRVVSEDGLMTASQAAGRALAAVGSVALLGGGLVPAFLGDGRALHDRLARTRVVAVRSAA